MKGFDLGRNEYQPGAKYDSVNIRLMFGIDGLSKKGVGLWESDDAGKVEYDDKFDLSPVANQQKFLDMCVDLRTKVFVLNKEVNCWMESFRAYQLANARPFPSTNFK